MAIRKKAKVVVRPKPKKLRSKVFYLSRMNTGRFASYEVFTKKDKALSNSGASESYMGEGAEFSMCSAMFTRATGIKFPKGQTREVTLIVGPPIKQPRKKKVKPEPVRSASRSIFTPDDDEGDL